MKSKKEMLKEVFGGGRKSGLYISDLHIIDIAFNTQVGLPNLKKDQKDERDITHILLTFRPNFVEKIFINKTEDGDLWETIEEGVVSFKGTFLDTLLRQ